MMKKIIVAVCVISVGLNIWLLGFALGGKADKFRHGNSPKHAKFEKKIEKLIEDLPRSAQREFIEAIRGNLPRAEGDLRKRIEEVNYKLAEALGGDAVDVIKAEEAFAEIRAAMTGAQIKFQEAFLKAARGLSPEDRKKVAEAILKNRKPL
ncbi:MAG: periplasmic heavy metal sensor [Deltaproteobacteria bacterium]